MQQMKQIDYTAFGRGWASAGALLMALLFSLVINIGVAQAALILNITATDDDGDGVLNVSDAFISDPAASVDTDLDGYPDSFHMVGGVQAVQADSTTVPKLSIDSNPLDATIGGLVNELFPSTGAFPAGWTLLSETHTWTSPRGTPILTVTPNNLAWVTTSAAVQAADVTEGTMGVSAFSNIHNSVTSFEIEKTVLAGDLTFDFKINTEAVYDYLEFTDTIVNPGGTTTVVVHTAVAKWDGELAWQGASFPLSAGLHRFKWTYTRDGVGGAAVSAAGIPQDTVFVDNVIFPTDSDGDGVVDRVDAFPSCIAASVNTDGDAMPDAFHANATPAQLGTAACNTLIEDLDDDNDGFTDLQDAFPLDASAHIDSDSDGDPDAWHLDGNNVVIPTTTNLHLDIFPNDPAASVDTDGDGDPDKDNWHVVNGVDVVSTSNPALHKDYFPNDAAASQDSDGDGYPDVIHDTATMTGLSVQQKIDIDAAVAITTLVVDAFPTNSRDWLDGSGGEGAADGVGDNWEIFYFNNTTTATSISDFNNDGKSDKAHFEDGTFPGSAGGIAAGAYSSLVLKSNGVVEGFGRSPESVVANGLTDVIAVAGGMNHSLALKADKTVVAWGSNLKGQAPANVGLTGVVAIAAGDSHSLALKSDGTVSAWGDAANNKLVVATLPVGSTSITAIAAGGNHSLALTDAGAVIGWGVNTSLQINIPVFGQTVTAIAAGATHSLALLADGTVVGWGANTLGQTTIPTVLAAAPLPNAPTVSKVAAGAYHSLALMSDGTVLSWGYNTTLPLTTAGSLAVPAKYASAADPAFAAVSNISAGLAHTLIVTAGGTVDAWGDDSFSQVTAAQGLLVSDSDGDGFPDASDDFPNDASAHLDTDKDGYPDAWLQINGVDVVSTTGLRLDAFINDAAASLDADGDGNPDEWNAGKTQFDSTTNLALDLFLGNSRHGADTDADGLSDEWEMLNYGNLAASPAADSDNDGIANIDEFNNGTDPVAVEDRHFESQRRLPPIVELFDMPDTMTVATGSYTVNMRVVGYDLGSYEIVMAIFDCTNVAAGTCGSNYNDANRWAPITMTPQATTQSNWSYNGIYANDTTYQATVVIPALNINNGAWATAPGTEIAVRFYQVSAAEKAAGNTNVSLLIPGGVATNYYDTTGRRISKRITP